MNARTIALSILIAAALSANARAGERVLENELVVSAPLAAVWDAFTTVEGAKGWMAPVAAVDFRLGGTIATHYDPKARIGDPGTIVRHVLAYAPQRMLAFRTDVPDSFRELKGLEQTWEITDFAELAPGRTRITVRTYGWGDDEAGDRAYRFFEENNPVAFKSLEAWLAKTSPPATSDPTAARELLKGLIGGDWIHEKEDGTFRVRNRTSVAPDGKNLVFEGWLGGPKGMWPHAHALVYADPDSGVLAFLSTNEEGNVARGTIERAGDDTVVWHWNETSLKGELHRYRVSMTFRGADDYRFLLELVDDGAKRPLVDVEFHRVMELPPEFAKMRP